MKFAKTKYELPKTSQERVKRLVEQAQSAGKLSRVQIAVWADQEYPSVHTKTLSSDQVRLAKERGEELKATIQQWEADIKKIRGDLHVNLTEVVKNCIPHSNTCSLALYYEFKDPKTGQRVKGSASFPEEFIRAPKKLTQKRISIDHPPAYTSATHWDDKALRSWI